MTDRIAAISRKTKETDISISINLDGSGKHNISTGVGFLDHMLTAIAVHGLFDLEVKTVGDLHIDSHHTIEDTGIVLGQCIDQALGDRKGINRMGHAYVTMDEALGFVALDLSGRPYTVFQADWHAPMIGQFPTTLVGHFFESIAFQAKMNLHAKVEYGRDDHHQAEALFKAFARALRIAIEFDPRRTGIASTKGTLTD
ncbi:MAG: imidazoleglycerol-phosphate dehydratase HisB [Chloroflexota bacterium]